MNHLGPLASFYSLLLLLMWAPSVVCGCTDSFIIEEAEEEKLLHELSNSPIDHFPLVGNRNESDTTSFFLENNHPAVVAMRERANQIARIKWSPLLDMLGNRLTGQEIKGIPYSSVKEMDKFIGQEVSFSTFLSAVNNPRSVLYTENVGEYPYNGINCSLYYGTVCSMAVNYALGTERPYWVSLIPTLSCFQPVAIQDFQHCASGDIIWVKNHVVLITDVKKDSDGNVLSIEILESGGGSFRSGTGITWYSIEQAKQRWSEGRFCLYRYKFLDERTRDYPLIPLLNSSCQEDYTNDEFCLSRGNYSCYRVGEDVVFNVFSSLYSRLIIEKNSERYIITQINPEQDIVISDLPAGLYQAYLENSSGITSEMIYFEMVDTPVSASMINNYLHVTFPTEGSFPEYLEFCKETGGRIYITDIQGFERERGEKIIRCDHSTSGLFLKVFFRGQYGRVSNKMLALK